MGVYRFDKTLATAADPKKGSLDIFKEKDVFPVWQDFSYFRNLSGFLNQREYLLYEMPANTKIRPYIQRFLKTKISIEDVIKNTTIKLPDPKKLSVDMTGTEESNVIGINAIKLFSSDHEWAQYIGPFEAYESKESFKITTGNIDSLVNWLVKRLKDNSYLIKIGKTSRVFVIKKPSLQSSTSTGSDLTPENAETIVNAIEAEWKRVDGDMGQWSKRESLDPMQLEPIIYSDDIPLALKKRAQALVQTLDRTTRKRSNDSQAGQPALKRKNTAQTKPQPEKQSKPPPKKTPKPQPKKKDASLDTTKETSVVAMVCIDFDGPGQGSGKVRIEKFSVATLLFIAYFQAPNAIKWGKKDQNVAAAYYYYSKYGNGWQMDGAKPPVPNSLETIRLSARKFYEQNKENPFDYKFSDSVVTTVISLLEKLFLNDVPYVYIIH